MQETNNQCRTGSAIVIVFDMGGIYISIYKCLCIYICIYSITTGLDLRNEVKIEEKLHISGDALGGELATLQRMLHGA